MVRRYDSNSNPSFVTEGNESYLTVLVRGLNIYPIVPPPEPTTVIVIVTLRTKCRIPTTGGGNDGG